MGFANVPDAESGLLSSRRTFLGRAAGALGVVATVGLATPSAARAAETGSEGVLAEQDRWRFCQKCFVMFYWGYPADGVCPAGGAHSAQGYNFVLPYNVPETPTAQRNWRFCERCYSMFWYGYPTNGRCAATGSGHVMQGYDFVLPHDISETSTRQRNWRFCQKCFVMFYWGYPTDGVCPSGGAHSAQGYNFVLPHV
ncbi:hypothetical protein [Streptomyces sp. 1222.5]|uniref:hypothetical protein n=1 Tax=Streptomyces sp. 1222.5 TaxID=1881026 RepID=UPI003D71E13E